MNTFLPTSSGVAREGVLQQAFGTSRTAPRQIAIIVAATGFVALCAHVSVPMPFTLVPLTLQTFAVVLLGMVLGPVAGFATLALYLAEGAMGLPVFSPFPEGMGGMAHLMGPTGGYLFAYPLAAMLAGAVARSLPPVVGSRMVRGIAAGTVATALMLGLGALWLGFELHLHGDTAWTMGVTPFLPGEAIKIVTAAGIFTTLERWKRV